MFSYYDARNVGDLILDEESGLQGKGVLVKDDDQPHYYWYNPDYPHIVLMPNQLPSMNKDRIDFNLINAKKNFNTGYLSLDFNIDNKFYFLKRVGEYEYNKNSSELDESIDVFINDELYDTIDFKSESEEDDMLYHIDIEQDVSLKNINIKFISKDKKNKLEDISEIQNLNTSRKSSYNINFKESTTEKIVNPIGWVNKKMVYETLTFTKMFSDSYKSPLTTNNLIYLDYKDDLNNYQWTLDQHIDATLNLKGYEDNQKINLDLDDLNVKNKYTYNTQDKFYYDEEKEKVYKGENQKYLNEEGIVLPWDFENNNGNLYFDLNIKTYQEYTIHFKLKIGNEFPLRGKKGRYSFKGGNNE